MSDSNVVRILVVVKAMVAGGLETYLVNVLSAIDRQKYKVTIVCTAERENWYKDELDKLGVKTITCPNPYSQIGYVHRIGKIIRELDIDVVCDFRSDFSAPTLLAAKRAGVKKRIAMYRNTGRGFRPDPLRNLYVNIMHRCTKLWATRIIGNTGKVLDAFYPGWKDNDKFAVVYNGVDLNKFSPDVSGQSIRQELVVSSDCIIIGHVGRFYIQKNHIILLKSFARLKQEVENIHLLLVGDGELRRDIEKQIKQLGIAEYVTLAGVRKDVPKMLAAMDIFFFPSLYEGMPNALIEAMACGLPIVASNIPEIVEIITTELSEQLIDPNDVTGFVEALRKLVTDKTSRKKMGFVGRTHVERHFELSVSAEKLCSYWAAEL